MKKYLLKHVLPILLALALLIAAAPRSAVRAQAAPVSAAGAEAARASAAVSKDEFALRRPETVEKADWGDGPEAKELELGAELELAFDPAQDSIWLSFAPETTGFYSFASYGPIDVCVNLWDQYGGWIDSDDDGGGGMNFSLVCYLEAGQTYYFSIGTYEEGETRATPFTVLLTANDQPISGFCGAQGDNLTWSFVPESGVLTIQGRGDMADFEYAPWDAFSTYITEVRLPEALTSIGANAFYNCWWLPEVTIPDGVTRIGGGAFLFCSTMRSVELPKSLVSIGDGAFSCCTYLSEIELPPTVTEIGSSAFEYCSLREITIPEGVTAIRDETFAFCDFLSSVTIPNTVTVIEESAFYRCDMLTEVSLPAALERIGRDAFAGCDHLKMLIIRSFDCLVYAEAEETRNDDDSNEDLPTPLPDRTLGGNEKTVIYGRHDPDLVNDPGEDAEEGHYDHLEVYAAEAGYTFYDLYAFTDVQEYSWYEIPVAWANGRGITSGVGGGKFAPKANCLREQVMTFLWAAADKPEPEMTENPFTDVNLNKYYAKPVLWAWENGVTGGATATTFGVGQVCTRAQVVTFLYAAAGKPYVYETENPFTDVKTTDYFYKPVLWAVRNGITSGTSPTTFSPKQTCTRAQVVTFLYAADNILQGGYQRGDDDEIYDDVFYAYSDLMEQARNAATANERYLLCAQAEAMLLGASVMLPTTTTGGAYAMSRVAPHTTPQVRWSEENRRLSGLVISDELLTRDERGDLDALWAAAVAGDGTYDPAAYLTGEGHSLRTDYAAPADNVNTLDWTAASLGTDIEILVNLVDGLVGCDELGDLQPALAESWEVSADGLTWTFHIRDGVYWYTSEGEAWAELTANDFVAGFHHMLDSFSGRVSLAGSGYAEIRGVDEYLWENGSFDNVGCAAPDEHTLVYTLNKPVPYFMTLLSYNIFLPLCDSFFRSRGGVYGIAEYQLTVENGSCEFGLPDDASSQVYCGPFLLRSAEASELAAVKNPNYYRADAVTLDTVRWVTGDWYDDEIYDKAVSGEYVGVELTQANGLLDRAKTDGYFYTCGYTTDTGTVTYFAALNLNRGTYALEDGGCLSWKNEAQKADTAAALQNPFFREALVHAIDRTGWNALARGDELAQTNLRNMLTPPDFVKLTEAVTDMEGHSFPAGTFYGEMVQYYCDLYGFDVDCADGTDGWYSPYNARANLELAKEALGRSVEWPIQIDLVYRGYSSLHYDQVLAWKESIEGTLGAENVTVNLVEAGDMDEWLQSCFYFDTGAEANYDVNDFLGWGPDYGDPMTYLNIFDREADGYMLKFCGLY